MPKTINLSQFQQKVLVPNDRRKRIDPSLVNKNPYQSIGLIEGRDHQGKKYFGTGYLIQSNKIVTAAHVFCFYDRKQKSFVNLQNLKFTLNNFQGGPKTFQIIDFRINPEYMKLTKLIKEEKDYNAKKQLFQLVNGQDYAMGKIDAHVNFEVIEQIFQFSDSSKNVDVYGFPYDKCCKNSKTGQLQFYQLGHSGTIAKIIKNQIFYEVDTECGQSGSPILISNQDKSYAIGIHTRYDEQTNTNAGVIFTMDIIIKFKEWSSEMGFRVIIYSNQQFFEYDLKELKYAIYSKSQLNSKEDLYLSPQKSEKQELIKKFQPFNFKWDQIKPNVQCFRIKNSSVQKKAQKGVFYQLTSVEPIIKGRYEVCFKVDYGSYDSRICLGLVPEKRKKQKFNGIDNYLGVGYWFGPNLATEVYVNANQIVDRKNTMKLHVEAGSQLRMQVDLEEGRVTWISRDGRQTCLLGSLFENQRVYLMVAMAQQLDTLQYIQYK